MRANKNDAGEVPAMRTQYRDDAEPLPTDGLEVHEIRDADTVRLFMLEWRRRLRHASPEASARSVQVPRPGDMIDR